jgi:filamentous hemagglutinin family protein
MNKLMVMMMNKYRYFTMIFTLGLCSLGHTHPSNPIIIQGTAIVENIDERTCKIATSDITFIYWDDFSIGENGSVELIQPSSKSVVVMQVTSSVPSALLGTLKANGNIFLVNPSGVQIGKNGQIDTSGFLVSTLSTCPCPLIDGDYDIFIQGSSKAQIVNRGRITASENDVYLFGYQIDNQGVIDAQRGTVAIAAGQEVVLNSSNGQKIGAFAFPIKCENEERGIDNSGKIIAHRVELKADGNAYGTAISHSGFIEIVGIAEHNGEAYLIAEKGNQVISGTISVEHGKESGGEIQILGGHISLFENFHVSGKHHLDIQGEVEHLASDDTFLLGL